MAVDAGDAAALVAALADLVREGHFDLTDAAPADIREVCEALRTWLEGRRGTGDHTRSSDGSESHHRLAETAPVRPALPRSGWKNPAGGGRHDRRGARPGGVGALCVWSTNRTVPVTRHSA